MAGRKDYYAVLGIDKSVGADEIKRAYRKLARKWHPDVNSGDADAEERFKQISEAYHVLGDEGRRKEYDRVGPEAFAQEFDLSDFADQFGSFFRGGFSTAGRGPAAGGDFGMFEEILGGLGGRGAHHAPGRPPVSVPGRHVRVPLQLEFVDAARGIERSVAYRTGANAGSARTRVRIPAGVRDGATIRVRGKGEPSPTGGPSGDLLLEVTVRSHPRLRRCGDADLCTDVPISIYEAVLGGKVRVPTLDGTATINLPRGTQSGQVFRLRGKGVGSDGTGRGDLLARVAIRVPETVDDDLVALMEQCRREHPYNPRTAS